MFRAATLGERRGGAALVASGSAAWAVGTFWNRCGGDTLGLSIPASTPVCTVL